MEVVFQTQRILSLNTRTFPSRKKGILYWRSFKCLEFRFCPIDNGRPIDGFSFYIFPFFSFCLPPCFCLVSIQLDILTACVQMFFSLTSPTPCILPLTSILTIVLVCAYLLWLSILFYQYTWIYLALHYNAFYFSYFLYLWLVMVLGQGHGGRSTSGLVSEFQNW